MSAEYSAGLGSRIAEARRVKGWTQAELAERSGLSTNTINRFENGRRVADALQLIQLGEALSCSPALLLGFPSEMASVVVGLAVKDDKNPGGLAEQENGGYGRLLVPGVNDGDEAFIVSSKAMVPYLNVGDIAVIKKGIVKTGDMVAFLDEWQNVNIRWLYKRDGKEFLVAENPECPPVEISGRERMIGCVTATVRVTKLK